MAGLHASPPSQSRSALSINDKDPESGASRSARRLFALPCAVSPIHLTQRLQDIGLFRAAAPTSTWCLRISSRQLQHRK